MDNELRRELERLSRRLDRIEMLLDIAPAQEKAAPVERTAAGAAHTAPGAAHIAAGLPAENLRKPVEPQRADAVPGQARGYVADAPPVTAPPVTPPPVKPPPVASPAVAPPAPPIAPPPTRPVVKSPPVARPTAKARDDDGRSIEFTIGGRWMAWVGALAVIVGVALFIKYAYDEGWFGGIPPMLRSLFIAAGGGAMILFGEVARRKINRFASVGLFAAGLGTLYLTALVSFHVGVYDSEVLAFLFLALVAVLGLFISMHSAMLSIGVLSIVAGYASPILLPGAGAFAAALPLFLTMLLGVALGLSALRPRPFRPMRYVAVGAHLMIATLWLWRLSWSGEGLLPIVFLSGWWAMLNAEALYAAIRRQSAMGNAVVSLLAAAWYVVLGVLILNATGGIGPQLLGAFTAGVGLLAGTTAFHFTGVEALRHPPKFALDRLAIALWAQAGVLLVVAAAIQFPGYGATIAWLAIATAAIEVGRRLPSRGLDVFGLIVAALALSRLFVYDLNFNPALQLTVVDLGPVEWSGWGVVALVAIAAVTVSAWRFRPAVSSSVSGFGALWDVVPVALGVLSVLLWVVVTAIELDGHHITIAWLLIALGAIEAGRRTEWRSIDGAGLFAGALGLMHLLANDINDVGLTEATLFAVGPIVFSGWAVSALTAIAVVTLGAWRFRRPDVSAEPLTAGVWAVVPEVMAVVSIALWVTLGAVELDGPYITAAWLLLSWCALEVGRRIQWRSIDTAAMIVGALALARLFLADLAESDLRETAFSVAEVGISQWGVVALWAFVVAHVASWRVRRSDELPWSVLGPLLTRIAMAVWLFVAAWEWSGLSITLAWLAGGVALMALNPLGRRLRYLETGLWIVMLTAGRWILFDALIPRLDEAWPGAAWPVFNLQVGMALLIAAAAWYGAWLGQREPEGVASFAAVDPLAAPARSAGEQSPALFLAFLFFAASVASFEIDRAVALVHQWRGESVAEIWPRAQLITLWVTLHWGLTGAALALLAHRRRSILSREIGLGVGALAAAVWLGYATLYFRFTVGEAVAATVIFNSQFLVGALLAAALAVAAAVHLRQPLSAGGRGNTADLHAQQSRSDGSRPVQSAVVALIASALIVLWLGSLEIDRFFHPEWERVANPAMARQTGWSIWWAVYGILLVAAGFRWRVALSRYAGLAMLALTLIKVVAVDMAEVDYIYRVLSFVGVGLLFVITSMGYAKMSPRLLRGDESGGANAEDGRMVEGEPNDGIRVGAEEAKSPE